MAKRDVSGALFRAIGQRDELRDALRAARSRVAKASARGGAKTKAKAARDEIERRYQRASRRVDQLAAQVPERRARKKAAPKPKPSRERAPAKKAPAPKAPAARGAREWEIGINYEGSRRNGNAVMVNFRLRKRGGGEVTEREARDAVRMLHRGESADDVRTQLGVIVDGVNWKRARWTSPKFGRSGDLDNFSGILQTSFLDDFRVSPVEPDE